MTPGAYATRAIYLRTVVLGRLEIKPQEGYFQVGQITYPDYYVQRNTVIYAIEIKTPRTQSLQKYMSDHFWTEKYRDGRSVMGELDARRKLLPSNVMQVMLFDVRNLAEGEDFLTSLHNSIAAFVSRKNWWLRVVNGVLFYDGKNHLPTKLISTDEVMGGKVAKLEQSNILSFMKKDKT
jgi:hypothetical protein